MQGELAAYGVQPQWFGLGDIDLGTHIARSLWLGEGLTPSQITERLATRWGLPEQRIRLLPMSDRPVETHVVVEREGGPEAIHFQQWWVGELAKTPAQRFVAVGLERAAPAPGVLEAIREADLILLPPSNPVVSIGIILGLSRGARCPARRRRPRWSGSRRSSAGARCAATPTPAWPSSASSPRAWGSRGCMPISSTAGWSTPPMARPLLAPPANPAA